MLLLLFSLLLRISKFYLLGHTHTAIRIDMPICTNINPSHRIALSWWFWFYRSHLFHKVLRRNTVRSFRLSVWFFFVFVISSIYFLLCLCFFCAFHCGWVATNFSWDFLWPKSHSSCLISMYKLFLLGNKLQMKRFLHTWNDLSLAPQSDFNINEIIINREHVIYYYCDKKWQKESFRYKLWRAPWAWLTFR